MRKLSRRQIPDDIQFEIIKKCPVKSVLKFRAVSKAWKRVIDTSQFIMERYRNTRPQRFLIRYHDDGYKFVSVADDDAFPGNSFIPNAPQPIAQLGTIIGTSLGLVCFFGPTNLDLEMSVAVIWNPTIKKTLTISLPNLKFNFEGVFGFGVCPVTCDPKFVKIENVSKIFGKLTLVPWDVEVFTLSTRVWRRPLTMLPRKHMRFDYPRFQVVIEGLIYWSAGVRSSDLETHVNVIVSFNLTNEEFREINVPGCLAHCHKHFHINKLRESLVLFHFDKELEPNVLKVWMMMDHDGSTSFTNTLNIYVPYEPIWKIHGFQKNDRLILEVDSQVASLEVYDPTEDASVEIEIYGDPDLYTVTSYTESLLLLDQPEEV